MNISISDYISTWPNFKLAQPGTPPWHVTEQAPDLVRAAIARLSSDYTISGDIAIHNTAQVEQGAVLKGPIILGPNTFVAANAYLRGGVFLDEDCIIGPSCEIKTTFMFKGSKVAHLSFVGDSLLGNRVNVEAGAIIANYRNEMDDKQIKIIKDGAVINTGVIKFGGLLGDDVKIGANSVIAPGALLEPNFRLTRLGKVDQHPKPL